ncbi:outer membrane protein assembly factor BamD [Corallibacter sp.]|uniref:outer membrane protein assembly factor BamD n=1 Tax=Corallibacter sp. TaxID=2038084 RepID=UPI003A95D746
MKNFFYIILTCTILSSCSEYQKALKSEDIATKFKVGEQKFNEGKYSKANKLFVQIVPNYRGKPQAEKLMYLYSMTFYEMGEYYLASYQFERFVAAYPNSEKLEEAAFLSAKSAYIVSDDFIYSKEQKETKDAIEKLQLFINSYPNSSYIAEANKLVKELDYKLEKKAFEIAKNYNRIAGFTRDYTAPIKAFENFIFDYPGSSFREEAFFYKLDSAYKLAMNSVEYKKEERLVTAKKYYNTFVKSYASSERIEEANKMAESIDKELENYSTKS